MNRKWAISAYRFDGMHVFETYETRDDAITALRTNFDMSEIKFIQFYKIGGSR